MSSCLENPVMPCAMTGACAVLSGFKGLSVVIHGSSGCYYYPRSILKAPLFSTYLLESEIVFGTVDRLHEVVSALEAEGKPVAVVNTCIPALTGEDLAKAFEGTNAVFVDAPGFIGNADAGVKAAYTALDIRTAETESVNIDGVCGLDLFSRGNLHEARRMLSVLGIPVRLSLASDAYAKLKEGAAPFTVSVNPSWNSGIGEQLGSFLFLDIKDTAAALEKHFPDADYAALEAEWKKADETMFYYADKYLRKYTPPTVAIAGQKSYCRFAEQMLTRYFGSDTVSFPREEITDYTEISAGIEKANPDLILGSTFEASADAAFFGITHPDRSRISMSARAVSGIEGGVMFLEGVLNSLMDFNKK